MQPENELTLPLGFVIELTESHDKEDVIQAYARWVSVIFSCSRTDVALLDPQEELIVYAIEDGDIKVDGEPHRIRDTILGHVSQTQMALVQRDVTRTSEFPDVARLASRGITSVAVVPLIFAGKALGALGLAFRATETFDDGKMILLETVARCLASYLLLHDQLRQLNDLSITDPLTGSFNRRHFQDVTRAAQDAWVQAGTPLSIAILDLDHFKAINDTHGHDFGDDVLREVAAVSQDFATGQETFVRLGGEEFCLVMQGTPLPSALARADDLRQRIASMPMDCAGVPVPVTASFGVAALGPGVPDVAAMMRRADEALYAAKHAGRNRVMPMTAQVQTASA
ncbi:GGDEF domain-containing protein [Aliishimia ponticola]|uniref:diguanylate cyclase n=1 Tax=Aliishimia ponticola TaxID=2499833 RepID=A0A4S4ND55_9RHOB|nr:sensor domain-containing diguanylate cyclase [Aliishimia ponticola]THH35961.1 GGDEF domain-containing protein [Aliishimia ponticola]